MSHATSSGFSLAHPSLLPPTISINISDPLCLSNLFPFNLFVDLLSLTFSIPAHHILLLCHHVPPSPRPSLNLFFIPSLPFPSQISSRLSQPTSSSTPSLLFPVITHLVHLPVTYSFDSLPMHSIHPLVPLTPVTCTSLCCLLSSTIDIYPFSILSFPNSLINFLLSLISPSINYPISLLMS